MECSAQHQNIQHYWFEQIKLILLIFISSKPMSRKDIFKMLACMYQDEAGKEYE